MRWSLLVVAVALSGCLGEVGDILSNESLSTRTMACRVFDAAEPLTLVVHVERGVDYDPILPSSRLHGQIVEIGGRDSADVARQFWSVDAHDGPWTRDALAEWADTVAVESADGLQMHVLWAHALDHHEPAGRVIAPGVLAIGHAEVVEGAVVTGETLDAVATAVLLHYAGHALGAVNNGIPVQDEDIESREYPAGHDPNQDSVMHTSWHDAATMESGHAPVAYSESLADDWRAARGPSGVCA